MAIGRTLVRLIVLGIFIIEGGQILFAGFNMVAGNQGTTIYFLWFPIATIAPSFATTFVGILMIVAGFVLLLVTLWISIKWF